MRILFVAATAFEVESLKLKVESMQHNFDSHHSPLTTHHSPLTTKLLTTGVGMVATAFAIGRELATNRYDLAINLGIAGSFDRDIALGQLAEVTHDTLAELGAEDDDNFIPIDQLGFGESMFKATARLSEFGDFPDIAQASAITVNTVHGQEHSINKIQKRIQPQLESMEGAAFFYACKQAGVSCMQIRAVSNYVEKRNRDNWQIELAIKNLNTFALHLLQVLQPNI